MAGQTYSLEPPVLTNRQAIRGLGTLVERLTDAVELGGTTITASEARRFLDTLEVFDQRAAVWTRTERRDRP